MKAPRKLYRPEDALLAGVCAELARALGWNVWAIRAVFLVGLFIHAPVTGASYLVGALVVGLFLGGERRDAAGPGGLASDQLEERGRRIQDLEKKFRDLERR